jgi:putative tryptophan/tyrosine transport system substrate-binding protein
MHLADAPPPSYSVTTRRGGLQQQAMESGVTRKLDIRRRNFIALLGGAAVTWPRATPAQTPAKSYRIGYLALLSGEDTTLMKPLLERLHELGYVEGKNMIFEYRSAEDHPERLPQLAVDLARADPDVLIAGFGTLAAKAAKAATTTIPIVITSVGDPVGAGLIKSLGQPGGNVTGVTSQASDVVGRRLQILQELIPENQVIAVLMNPDTPFSRLALQELRAAANPERQRFAVFEARTADDVRVDIESAVKEGTAGLLTLDDPLMLSVSRQIADLATKARLPTIFGSRDFAEAGGLMSYGVDRRQLNRRAAEFVDKILQGARPADLPVEQPTKFELVVNLKTAKALGLDMPAKLLALADEVIE